MSTDKLMTVPKLEGILSSTEGIGSLSLDMSGAGSNQTVFSLPSGWNIGIKDKEDTEVTEATLAHGQTEYQLTKEAIMAIAHAVGISPAYVARTPGVLIQTHLNYWASHSPDLALKMLTKGDVGLAIAKEGIKPFSNIEILENVLESMEFAEVLVDYKTSHDLHTTSMRLVFPEESVTVDTVRKGGEVVTDTWVAGVQIRNSLIGKVPLSVQPYFMEWDSTNGVVIPMAEGRYNRKIQGQESSDLSDWIQTASEAVKGSWDHGFEILGSLPDESVASVVSQVMADMFKTYRIPLKVRNLVLDRLVDSEDLTYYGIVHAISSAANEPLPEHFVTAILEICGDVASSAHARCNSCQRVLA